MFDFLKKNKKEETQEKTYMMADEARSISDVAEEERVAAELALYDIDGDEFIEAVKEYTYRCLERYIPQAAKGGYHHEVIVPKHYNVNDDDTKRIMIAKDIVEEIVSPYGYNVDMFYNTNMIRVSW